MGWQEPLPQPVTAGLRQQVEVQMGRVTVPVGVCWETAGGAAQVAQAAQQRRGRGPRAPESTPDHPPQGLPVAAGVGGAQHVAQHPAALFGDVARLTGTMKVRPYPQQGEETRGWKNARCAVTEKPGLEGDPADHLIVPSEGPDHGSLGHAPKSRPGRYTPILPRPPTLIRFALRLPSP